MTDATARLLAEALRLPEPERGELAAQLIDSLDPAVEDGAHAAGSAEIRQRLDELQNGQVQPIPWPEARRMIMDDSDRRRVP